MPDTLVTIRQLLTERMSDADSTAVDLDTTLEALGVDSVDILVLLTHFEDAYDVEFPGEAVEPLHYATVRELVAVIERTIAAA